MGIILEAVGVLSKQTEPSLNISRAWIFIAQGARTVAAGGGGGGVMGVKLSPGLHEFSNLSIFSTTASPVVNNSTEKMCFGNW